MDRLIHLLDILLNGMVGVVWLMAGGLLIIRHMEKQGLRYDLERIPEGIKFWYSLGVYGGTVCLKRIADQEMVQLTRTVYGWVCKFPPHYTNDEMCKYVAKHLPCMQSKGSHTKDLGVFNEIVNNKNTYMASINGGIYVYEDRRKVNRTTESFA